MPTSKIVKLSIFAAFALLLFPFAFMTVKYLKPELVSLTPKIVRIQRMRVSVSSSVMGGNWDFVIESRESGSLTIRNAPVIQRRIDLNGKIEDLERAVARCHFFDLPKQIGHRVPDGGELRIRVAANGMERKIVILYTKNDPQTWNVENALELSSAIHSFFDHDIKAAQEQWLEQRNAEFAKANESML